MGGCYLLKYNGGDSGIKISVLYLRCSLIRVSVIRGLPVFLLCLYLYYSRKGRNVWVKLTRLLSVMYPQMKRDYNFTNMRFSDVSLPDL
jgi:hypothetical protein